MNIDAYEILLPPITDQNKPYFDGLDAGELRLQHCPQDDTWVFPATPVCPTCLTTELEWLTVSGKATLWSWIRIHQQYFEAYADERPYQVAFVKLAEGPFMMTRVLAEQEQLSIDADLELEMTVVGTHQLPTFRLA